MVSSSSFADCSSSFVVSSSSFVDWSFSKAVSSLSLRLLQRLLQAAIARYLGEGDSRRDDVAVRGDQRCDLDVNVARVSTAAPLDVAKRDHVPLFEYLLDSRPELDGPEGDLEILERSADVTLSQTEQCSCLEVCKGEIPVAVDDELREGDGLETGVANERLSGELLERLVSRRGRSGDASLRQQGGLREDAPLEIDRDEELRACGETFRLSEEEVTALSEREVEVLEHTNLRRGVEVHQRVAREQQ